MGLSDMRVAVTATALGRVTVTSGLLGWMGLNCYPPNSSMTSMSPVDLITRPNMWMVETGNFKCILSY